MIISLDVPLVTYFAIVIVSLYGFGLFVWWWTRMGKASEVYKYVMMLFLATAFEFFTAIYARIGFLTKSLQYDEFMTSMLWELRALPVLIILLMLVVRMTVRVCATITAEMDVKASEGQGGL